MIRLMVVAAIWLLTGGVYIAVLLGAQWVSNNGPEWLLSDEGPHRLGLGTLLATAVVVITVTMTGLYTSAGVMVGVDESSTDRPRERNYRM